MNSSNISYPLQPESSTEIAYQDFMLAHGPIMDLSDDPFPTLVHGFENSELSLAANGTHFGYVQSGTATLTCESGRVDLKSGTDFSIPGRGLVHGAAAGIVVTRLGVKGQFQIGGPIEARGRLAYVDGCTDSLLIPPVLLGDPCLNLLHIPPHTRQSSHTHSSIRTGLIAKGSGRCVTPHGVHPLEQGHVFLLNTGAQHCFHTDDDELVVITYHPDSDFGPSHQDHPMINRTYVAGISAAQLPHIQSDSPKVIES